jgi:hypothetical protein
MKLKFRVPVYSHRTGEFIRFSYWDAHALVFTIPQGCFSNDEVYKDDEQYSGINDSQGIPIYENDILIDEYGNIGLCFHENTEWVFIDHSGCIESGIKWRVIGNPHQNPDLLRRTK